MVQDFIILFFLLVFSGLISGSEVAFFSLNIPSLKKNKGAYIEKILQLLSKPKRLLATILISNNFINIGIVIISIPLTNILFENIENDYLRFLVDVGIVSFLILFFGEILPKIYANKNNLFCAKFMAFPLLILDKYILFWMTIPMSKITGSVEKRLYSKKKISIQQISEAFELTSKKDTTSKEHEILQKITLFGNIETKKIMCPRIDVFALSISQTTEEIIPIIIKNGYSRIPVYQDNLDTIKGILHIKDLLPNLYDKNAEWQSYIQPPYYVPENKKLDDLLKEFQLKKKHLAIVVDEYGGTSGIITLEDIIEQIVGDINDEFDTDKLSNATYTKINDKVYIIDGKISLFEMYEILKINNTEPFEIAKKETETLAGFILEVIKRFPDEGEEIQFQDITFKIQSIIGKRINKIKVTLK